PLQGEDRHQDSSCGPVLGGRGLSPGLLQEEPTPISVLQDGLRSSSAAGADLGPAQAPADPYAIDDRFGDGCSQCVTFTSMEIAPRRVQAATAMRWSDMTPCDRSLPAAATPGSPPR